MIRPTPARRPRRRAIASAAAVALATLAQGAAAVVFETGDDDLKIRWDNTLKYSTGIRLKAPDAAMVGGSNANFDDGDLNFKKHGLISNRIDVLSEFDISADGKGLRLSGTAWYDSVYRGSTDNLGTSFYNTYDGDFSRFAAGTRRQHGSDGQVLDAFVFGNFDLGSMAASVRLGRHLVIYGESFFGGGVSDAQGAVDIAKVLSVPGTQVKEFLLPTEQVSTSLQVNAEWTLGAYYQFRWHASRPPGVGSYFAFSDVAVPTAQTIVLGPGIVFPSGPAIEPHNHGQWGAQLRYKPADSATEYGLYAARFHGKAPATFMLDFTTSTMRNVYTEDTDLVGGSISRSFDSVNFAAEASVRRNQSLNAGPILYLPPAGNTNTQPALGRTAHVQASVLALLPPSALFDGGVLIAELAWQRVLGVTHNPMQLNPATLTAAPLFSMADGKTRDVSRLTLLFSPSYFQVASGLDLEVPVVVNAGLTGRSSIDAGAVGWRKGVGSVSLGLNATYLQVWKAGLSYTRYYGPTGTLGDYGQLWKDRDYISFNVRRTF